MNTLYALMLVTTTGVVEAPNTFNNLADCEKVSSKIQNTYCVKKEPIDFDKKSKEMMKMFKSLVNDMDKL